MDHSNAPSIPEAGQHSVEEVSNSPWLRLGENKTVEYTVEGVGDPRVALFAATVRDTPRARIESIVRLCLAEAEGRNDAQVALDTFALAFQARHCRGGKGERRVFVWILLEFVRAGFGATVRNLLVVVPFFGYWKDLLVLVEAACGSGAGGGVVEAGEADQGEEVADPLPGHEVAALKEAVITLLAEQLRKDLEELQGAGEGTTSSPPSLSLVGKYLPREGNHFDRVVPHLVRDIAAAAFPGHPRPKVAYRRACTQLNSALATPEVFMSSQRWEELEYDRVASLCMTRNRQAFLRHDRDRLELAALQSKLHGAQSSPVELCNAAVSARSNAESALLDAQWASMREAVVRQVQEAAAARQEAATASGGSAAEDEQGEEAVAGAGAEFAQSGAAGEVAAARPATELGRLVALVDVSASMRGTPMEVALALGILVSELASDEFKNEVLTFESSPRWHRLPDGPAASLRDKVVSLGRAPWGGSTNFSAALSLILERCVANRTPANQVPDLIVFSDMQFDCAHGGGNGGYPLDCPNGEGTRKFSTALEGLRRDFHLAGIRAVGEPYPLPTITFWNLRGNTLGFSAQADTPGVRMLSGYSPALFKLLVMGGPDEEEEEVEEEEELHEGEASKKEVAKRTRAPKITPYQTMRNAIDDSAYDLARALVLESGQAMFAGGARALDGSILKLLEYVRKEPEARQLKRKREEAEEEKDLKRKWEGAEEEKEESKEKEQKQAEDARAG